MTEQERLQGFEQAINPILQALAERWGVTIGVSASMTPIPKGFVYTEPEPIPVLIPNWQPPLEESRS